MGTKKDNTKPAENNAPKKEPAVKSGKKDGRGGINNQDIAESVRPKEKRPAYGMFIQM